MSLFAISGLAVLGSCIFFTLITFYFGKTKLHRVLLMFNIVVAVWGLGNFLAGIVNNPDSAIFGWKIAHIGGFFVGPSFYFLVSILCNLKRKKLILFGFIQAIIFIVLCFSTNLIINDVRYIFDVYVYQFNSIYFFGFSFYILFVVLSFYELVTFLPKTSGFKHKQIKYIILGFSFGFIGATSNFLPVFNIDILYPAGNFGIPLYVFFLTYAILRYNLMDLYLVLRRTIVYSISVSLLTGLFIVLVLTLTYYLSAFTGITSFTITVISALIIAILFDPLKNIIQSFFNKIFFKTTYNYYNIIQKAGRELSSTIDLKFIYESIVDTIFEALGLKKIYLLSAGENNFQLEYFRVFQGKHKEEENIDTSKITADSEIIKLLIKNKTILLKQVLVEKSYQEEDNNIENVIKLFYGEVIVPIFIDNDLLYILILGEKLSEDFFTNDDINLLDTISNQAAISLKNARLFDRLEVLVEQRTSELSNTNSLLKKEVLIRKNAERQLKHQAYYDSLTNLPNRAMFFEHLKSSIQRKKRYESYFFSVFFMDVDRFKVVNDSLGHQAGDELLIIISDRIRKSIREVDIFSRFGGDEFAILLEGLKKETDIQYVANKIHNVFERPFNIQDKQIVVSISIGIVSSSVVNHLTPEEFIRDADTALYVAKEQGKACHVIFEPNMHTQAITAIELESELRRAIKQNELKLYYQPFISVSDNKLAGFEALIRWFHPKRGLLPPSEFISVAEETDLIVDIDKWVLGESLRQMKMWNEKSLKAEDLTISINISNKFFLNKNFLVFVKEMLEKTGYNGKKLRMEINETIIINNMEITLNIFKGLQKMGIMLDVDDFGSGNSVLNYLRYLPVNGLKVDQSFINTLASNKYDKEIVHTIVRLAHILKLDVTAEGVENKEQLEIFKNMQGEYAQGYYINRPLDINDVEKIFFS